MSARPARYHLFATEFGVCGIGWTAAGISHFQLAGKSEEATNARMRTLTGADGPSETDGFAADAVERLTVYFTGARSDFSNLPLDLADCEPFTRAVLEAARRVGWGDISSYGALARDVADVSAARAVGQVMGNNPIPVIIPCHRILAADGSIGGFSAPGGTATKTRLLEMEGALSKSPALAQIALDL